MLLEEKIQYSMRIMMLAMEADLYQTDVYYIAYLDRCLEYHLKLKEKI